MPRATKRAEKGKRPAKVKGKRTAKGRRKTSIYLDAPERRHLERIAKETGRPQAQLIREAIMSHDPTGSADRNFALAGGFARIDADPRPISAVPEEELMQGFGE